MTLEYKTPKARKEARSYCRRCLAVMLCCVLAFGLTVRTAPRAKAAIVDGTSAVEIVGGPNLTVIEGGATGGAETAGASVTGGSFGAFLLAACGINMLVDSVDYTTTRYYGGTPNEKGNELWAYLYDLGGDIGAWCTGIERSADENGGIRPGDSFSVPAEVAEAARQWAATNLTFTDGIVTFDDASIATSSGDYFVLTECDFSGVTNWKPTYEIKAPLVNLGHYFTMHKFSWLQSDSYVYSVGDIKFQSAFELSGSGPYSYFYKFGSNLNRGGLVESFSLANFGVGSGLADLSKVQSHMDGSFADTASVYNAMRVLSYSPVNNRIYYGTVSGNTGYFYKNEYLDLGNAAYTDIITHFPTTMTKTPALDEPKTKDLTITIPPELPTTQVGELTIPVITEITSTDLTEIGGADNPSVDPTPSTGITPNQITEAVKEAWPATGSPIGDQTIEETMDNSDDLQKGFISKFPFCIPWDIVQAIKLLAAPPVTPRWEIDLYGPLQGKWGFHADTTSIVIDLTPLEPAAVVTRWVSTIMFIYGLASATKRYIWTA